ncbi:MAG: hypothetical protein NTZ93_04885 [Candidatus Beckwithbacteria bacterium]|nr:hypothetical protein [Candidatus Beckwithbacteria bacterium]
MKKIKLRYGENPHQQGWIKKIVTSDPLAWFKFKKLQGKELSFNNYLDMDAAVTALSFIGQTQAACVIIKHTNPCGASRGEKLDKIFLQAWEGDSLAAFGGIVAINRPVDDKLAELMLADKRFFEILLCPAISTEALKIMSRKKDLRILVNPALSVPVPNKALDRREIRGGLLEQERDIYKLQKKDWRVVTKVQPTPQQVQDMLMAWEICRVSKSNTIALVKDQQLVANGVGQQDRVRCCQLAVSKAWPGSVIGAVAASDAFFPFSDGPGVLIKAGVKAIIQSGGSIRDQETIDLANQKKISMIFTGIRCFKH